MASRKQLAQLDILAVTNLNDPGSGFVGFSAKMDGLYQKIGAAADARLLTAVDIGVNVAAYNHSHPYLLLSGGVMSNANVVTNLNADLLDGQHGSYYASAAHNHSGVYQPLDADLTAIAALAGTSGLLKKTAADTWTLDTTTYVSGTPWTGMGYVTGTPWTGMGYVTGTPWTGMGYVTGTPWTGMGYLTANQAHTLDSHSNVTITSNAAGEILKWNGSAWINNTLAEAGIQPAGSYVTGTPWTGMGYVTGTPWTGMGYVTGTPWTGMGYLTANQSHTLDSHSNVTITSNAAGEILKWNGSAWVNNTLAEAGIQPAGTYVTGTPWTGMGYLTANQSHTLDSHSNVTITSNAAGEILKWNGSAWVNNTLAEAGIQPAGTYVTGTPWTGMGYVTGGPYQPLATNLTSLTNLAYASTSFVKMTAAGTFTLDTTAYVTGTPWTGMGYVTGTPWTGMGYVTGTPWTGYGYTTTPFPSGNGIPIVANGNSWGTTLPTTTFALRTGEGSIEFSSAGFRIPTSTGGTDWILKNNGAGGFQIITWNGSSASTYLTLDASGVTATNFVLSSDIRLKQNINAINITGISKINFVEFSMKADSSDRKRYGVIAQEVEKVAPELVYTNGDGMKSVAYIDLLIAKISDLEKRLKKCENEK